MGRMKVHCIAIYWWKYSHTSLKTLSHMFSSVTKPLNITVQFSHHKNTQGYICKPCNMETIPNCYWNCDSWPQRLMLRHRKKSYDKVIKWPSLRPWNKCYWHSMRLKKVSNNCIIMFSNETLFIILQIRFIRQKQKCSTNFGEPSEPERRILYDWF